MLFTLLFNHCFHQFASGAPLGVKQLLFSQPKPRSNIETVLYTSFIRKRLFPSFFHRYLGLSQMVSDIHLKHTHRNLLWIPLWHSPLYIYPFQEEQMQCIKFSLRDKGSHGKEETSSLCTLPFSSWHEAVSGHTNGISFKWH